MQIQIWDWKKNVQVLTHNYDILFLEQWKNVQQDSAEVSH